MRRSWLVVMVALTLVGCAVGPNVSYVTATNTADNQVIATSVAGFLRTELPAARSTLVVQPTATGDTALLALMCSDLRRQGFALAEPNSGASGGQSVRLLVTPFYNGFIVRIDYAGRQASTYFGRDGSGRLESSSPFVLRVAAQ